MSIVRKISYTEPVIGADREITIVLDLAEVEVGGTRKACVVASVAGRPAMAVNVDEFVQNAIYGQRHDGFYGRAVTKLTGKEAVGQTALSVESIAGFSDGDPIAIFNNKGDLPTYHLVNGAPSGSTITVTPAISDDRYEGAWVVNLLDAVAGEVEARGYNYQQGAKAAKEAPSPVTISAADGTGDTVDVTVTANDEDQATHFDVYVREVPFTRIEPNWVPDAEDQTSTTINVSTFEGGADCVPDGGGGSLVSSSTYYIAAVVKNGTGRTGNAVSEISNIISFTLD